MPFFPWMDSFHLPKHHFFDSLRKDPKWIHEVSRRSRAEANLPLVMFIQQMCEGCNMLRRKGVFCRDSGSARQEKNGRSLHSLEFNGTTCDNKGDIYKKSITTWAQNQLILELTASSE